MFTVQKSSNTMKTVHIVTKTFLMVITLALVALLSYMYGSQMIQASVTEDAMSTRPFHELESMRITVLVLGLLLVTTLIYSRIYLGWQNKKMYGYTQLMLDKTPLGCSLWDENLNFIDCNKELSRLFGLSDKREFPTLFLSFSPKYQPCGSESRIKAHNLLKKAFSEGYCRTEWDHLTLSGEQMPCEVIFQRIQYQRGYFVAAYVRDLREQKAMIEKLKEADEHMRILMDSAPLSCSLWDENFNLFSCNQETANLFGLLDKDSYISRFYELSPKYQPCGRESAEMVHEIFDIAFKDGYCRSDWMHQNVNGEPIPCEVIVVRVMYRGKKVLAAYVRDLREKKTSFLDFMHEAQERAMLTSGTPEVNCSMIWDTDELKGLVGFIGKLEDHLKGILAKTGKHKHINNNHCSGCESVNDSHACFHQLAGS
jgi:PAS domain-containing protein